VRSDVELTAAVSSWPVTDRLQSRSLESRTDGLQSLWLASRLKPWLRTIDGLRWLIAYVYKQENERQQIRTVTSVYLIIMSNPTPKIVMTLFAVDFLAH